MDFEAVSEKVTVGELHTLEYHHNLQDWDLVEYIYLPIKNNWSQVMCSRFSFSFFRKLNSLTQVDLYIESFWGKLHVSSGIIYSLEQG